MRKENISLAFEAFCGITTKRCPILLRIMYIGVQTSVWPVKNFDWNPCTTPTKYVYMFHWIKFKEAISTLKAFSLHWLQQCQKKTVRTVPRPTHTHTQSKSIKSSSTHRSNSVHMTEQSQQKSQIKDLNRICNESIELHRWSGGAQLKIEPEGKRT